VFSPHPSLLTPHRYLITLSARASTFGGIVSPICELRFISLHWYASLVDKGQRKRTADVAEKLGVGLLLATMAQGIFAEKLTAAMYGIGALALATAILFIVLAIYLSKED